GNDTVRVGSGNNSITAGNGNDCVQAGNGNNTITVGNGNDNIVVGSGSNIIVAGTGSDTIRAGDGNNLIVGGAGPDTIQGGKGNNILMDGRLTLTQPGDTLAKVLADWTKDILLHETSAQIATAIRPRLSVTFNTTNANTITAGKGLDWFWATYSHDHTNRK